MGFSPNIDKKSDRMYWREHFNENAEKFDDPAKILDFSNQKLMNQIHESIVEMLDLKNGYKILDAGCGTGSLVITLFQKYPNTKIEIICIDIAEKILKKCVHTLTTSIKFNNCTLNFVQMDILHLGFRDNSFDISVSSESLQYIDPYEGLLELIRVTKKGGSIIVSVPNKRHPIISKAEKRNRGYYRGADIYRLIELCKNFSKKIYIKPLIFAKDQSKKPYMDMEPLTSDELTEYEISNANRFIVKIESLL